MTEDQSHSFNNPLVPHETLYDFDGPRIFTFKDDDDELFLASWCDEGDDHDVFIAVPTSRKIVHRLKNGEVSVLDALDQPRCWLIELGFDGTTRGCIRRPFEELPTDCLPRKGTMLLPSLQPVLTLRAVGDAITPGRVPGSVIRACVEGPQKALKLLSEFVLGKASNRGKPADHIRRLFDLPTQRVAFSSFEISFRLPEREPDLFNELEDEDELVLSEIQQLLKQGLEWTARGLLEDDSPFPDDETIDVSLRALKELTPAASSSIERLEIGGTLTGAGTKPFVTSASSRRRINTMLREKQLEPEQREFRGLIRELDKYRLTFELRDPRNESELLRFTFDDDILDEALEAFAEDIPVRVIGKTFASKGTSEALAILLDEPDSPL